MKKVALVTDSVTPALNVSDKRLVSEFKKAGIKALGVPWDDVGVEWEDFEAVILRSCWNYHERYALFGEWLDGLQALGVAVWNPIDVVKTNTHKSYLLELEKKGVSIVPSELLTHKDCVNVGQIMELNGWEEVVIKSAVGASAYNMQKFTADDIEAANVYGEHLKRQGDIVVQQFMTGIYDGEQSLVFFNKEYMFGMIKMPKKGDFRFSPRLGGTEWLIDVPDEIIVQTQTILSILSEPLLYSRVDGVVQDGRFYLMELELTEPYLFFEREKRAAKRFVDAYLTLRGQ